MAGVVVRILGDGEVGVVVSIFPISFLFRVLPLRVWYTLLKQSLVYVLGPRRCGQAQENVILT
jgi:hypothetical protein